MPEAIGGVVGALIGGSAAESAADTQAASANRATDLQRYIYDTNRTDQAPYRDAGVNALSQLSGFQEPSLSAADVMAEPGYQFGLQQGLNNVQSTAAARGGLYSGNALKALTRYGNDYATQQFNNAFNRQQSVSTSRWNRLASLAGIGQTANNQVNQAGQNFANQAGANMMGAANAQGAAGIAQANLWGNAINQGISSGGRNNWWGIGQGGGGASVPAAGTDNWYSDPYGGQ